MDLVRLACVKHAASVRPEPGSNSPTRTCSIARASFVLRALTPPVLPGASVRSCSTFITCGQTSQKCVRPELTSSSITKGDVLPALSFSLLFRFQGAVARATHTHSVGQRRPPDRELVSQSGAFQLPEARNNTIHEVRDPQPLRQEISTRW